MNKSITLEVNSIPFAPHLAVTIGDSDATLVLQQLFYWMQKAKGRIVDGQKWIYNRLTDWLEQFPWLSEWKLRRVFRKLQDLGLVKFAQHDKSAWKRVGFYTIDFERLEPLLLSKCGISHFEVRTVHTSKCGLSTPLVEQKLLPEKTSETTTNAASLKFDQESNPDLSVSLKNPARAINEELKITAAVLKFDQESSPDLSASLESSTKAVNEELKTTVEDQCSAAPTEDEKIEIVEGAGVAANPHLIRTLTNFTLEQVKAAVSHYQAVIAKGTQINNSAGWLSDCLKGKWWEQSKAPEPTYAYGNVITAADQEKVETAPMPTDFSNMLKAAKKFKQELSRSRTKSLGFA